MWNGVYVYVLHSSQLKFNKVIVWIGKVLLGYANICYAVQFYLFNTHHSSTECVKWLKCTYWIFRMLFFNAFHSLSHSCCCLKLYWRCVTSFSEIYFLADLLLLRQIVPMHFIGTILSFPIYSWCVFSHSLCGFGTFLYM